MNLEEVKKFLAENKDDEQVQAFLDSLKVDEQPTLEVFKELVETDPAFKAFMDSQKDKHYGKALETWKENNLQKIVQEQVSELYPEDDPKDIELQKLKREFEEMKSAATREKMTNLALKKATELNLPTELIDYFVATDEEATLGNIEKFHSVYTEDFQEKLRNKLKGQGDDIPNSDQLGNIGTKEGILAIEDDSKRHQAIKENIHLFN